MKKVLNIAWTFDDGPTCFTRELLTECISRGITNLTWFISRKNVYAFNYFDSLKLIVQSGGEIGIHEIHPVDSEINWFPRATKCFPSIQSALVELDIFIKELHSFGIYPKFVRLPGGEHSELMAYFDLLGCTSNLKFRFAMDIIDNIQTPYPKIKEDYRVLQDFLQKLGLKIWSGTKMDSPLLGGLPFHYNSWQAECAGVRQGRGANSLTYNQAKDRQGLKEIFTGIFEQKIDEMCRNNCDGSLIILAHDVTKEDVEKIIQDIDYSERYALKNNIEIIYHTLSSLYSLLAS